jgi:predicted HicB family RNase H-like nuclease
MENRASILIRIPLEIKEQIKQQATNRGITVNSLISQVLWEYLNRRKGDIN